MLKHNNLFFRLFMVSALLLAAVPAPVEALTPQEDPPLPDSTWERAFLPLIASGGIELPPGYSGGQGTTDSYGNVLFSEPNANGTITVRAQDDYGNRISGATVYFLSTGTEGRALVITPDQRVGWATGSYPSVSAANRPDVDPFTITLIAIIAAGTLATYHLIEFSNHPPRFDQELGYERMCVEYEAFKHLAGAGLSIFALHTAVAHSGLVALGELGAEKFVTTSADAIEDATGKEWPWAGTWCFRKSEFIDIPVWTPETDSIRHAQWYATLRWDKGDTDVDLRVTDSFGNHAYFGDMEGIPGGELDRDDQDGWGPEIYRQITEEGSRYYEIRVHYYSDHGNGSTNATLNVFDEQDIVVYTGSKRLYDDDWWYVTTVYPDSLTSE